MKIKKVTKRKNKLIYLNILKTKTYDTSQLSNIKNSTKQTELYFKKAAQILYKYNISGKRILFLGFPASFQSVLKNTKHVLIPESNWLNGLITNQILRFNYSLTKQQKRLPFKIVQLLLELKKKIDLVVVFNLNNNISAVNESYSARIPIIGSYTNFGLQTDKVTYKVTNNFKLVNDNFLNSNFFISMIKLILKKSILMTSKKSQIKYYNSIKTRFKKKYKTNLRKLKPKHKLVLRRLERPVL